MLAEAIELQMQTLSPCDTLTDREREMVDLVTLGWTDQQIADRMNISFYHAKRRLQVVFDKLGFNKRIEVALWRLSRGNE